MMNKRMSALLLTTALLGSVLMACSDNDESGGTTEPAISVSPSPSDSAMPDAEPGPTLVVTASPEASSEASASPDAEPAASSDPSKPSADAQQPSASRTPAASQSTAATKKPVAIKTPSATKTPAPTRKPTASPTAAPTKKPAVLPSVSAMYEEMVKNVEQPALMELDGGGLKERYNLDPSLPEEYTVRLPLMNIKTNEIAIFKVKAEKDIPTIKAGMEKRAKDVQKQFEHYLPDQYENAKNYKIVSHGPFVLFVISDESARIIQAFDAPFQN